VATESTAEKNESGGGGASLLPLIVVFINTLLVLGVAGLLYYTKLVFKRPAITEATERAALAKKTAGMAAQAQPLLVNFDMFTVNIEAMPNMPQPADGTERQLQSKLHYVTLGFALQLRDGRDKEKLDELTPVIMDHIIALLGHKRFSELTSVQGRYVLRSQIIDQINDLATKHAAQASTTEVTPTDVLVTEIYFNQFIVQ
jgi:flagellar basal body-associated protein FliL